ncbi:protein ILRUN-like [Zophobas morio]|uniref:protein ILRUN-like n=1 Tax=Zophobas morio TaxID=2755281 RepID=UPI003083B48E
MKLISTTTIPSFLRPGETFRQTWRLSNSGRSSWPLRSYLIPVSGYLLKGAQPVDVPSLFPGSECEIGLSFCCPSTPGQYALSWKMWSEDNCVYFGEQIWTVVIVNEVAPAEEKREMDCENQVANLEAAFSRL